MRKALVVGLTEYENCPLDCCANDAEVVTELLERNEDGSKNFHVMCCKYQETKGELYAQICELFKDPNDVALLYFSGHGYVDDNKNSYLVTTDFNEYDYGVRLDDILHIVNASPARNKIIILDSCFSGKMGTSNIFGNTQSLISEGTTILTSSRDYETSVAYDDHSLFTMLLVEALKGGAADILGNISLGSIYAYIDRALGAWQQRPLFKTNVSSFLSLRKIKPPVSSECIRKLVEYFPNSTAKYSLDPSYEYTNSPEERNTIKKPYAKEENVKIFKDLQKMESIGLVKPNDEEHMYFAAINSKSCELTSIGRYYWKLANEDKI